MNCAIKGCRRKRWGQSHLCLAHFLFYIDAYLPADAKEQLHRLLDTLLYREREMLKLISGIGDGYAYTRNDIAQIFHISSSTVQRIENKAGQKLLHPAKMCALDDLITTYLLDEVSENLSHALIVCNEEILKYIEAKPERIRSLTFRGFEKLILEILKHYGFDVELTRQTKDGGRDIIGCTTDGLGIPTRYIVECKKYAPTNKVGVVPVRALYGVKTSEKADHAILATTSTFTKGAWEFASRPEVWNLHLKGYEEILKWIREGKVT